MQPDSRISIIGVISSTFAARLLGCRSPIGRQHCTDSRIRIVSDEGSEAADRAVTPLRQWHVSMPDSLRLRVASPLKLPDTKLLLSRDNSSAEPRGELRLASNRHQQICTIEAYAYAVGIVRPQRFSRDAAPPSVDSHFQYVVT